MTCKNEIRLNIIDSVIDSRGLTQPVFEDDEEDELPFILPDPIVF